MNAGNGITSIAGVRVGHFTDHKNNTGVTAIFPCEDPYRAKLRAGASVLNGAGEITGLSQVLEWGTLETPIFLAGTRSVGIVWEAAYQYMLARHAELGKTSDVVLPVVGECDDSWLSDIRKPLKIEDVFSAIETAHSGPVTPGSVGGGTGMISFGLKSGIGSTSTRVAGEFNLGVLVQSNFGTMDCLTIRGNKIGPRIAAKYQNRPIRKKEQGSSIVVVATDAPLDSQQLARLSKRTALGLARLGFFAAHGSGDFAIAFSTSTEPPNAVRATADLDAFFQTVVDLTEDAVIQSLECSEAVTGRDGHFAPSLAQCGAASASES